MKFKGYTDEALLASLGGRFTVSYRIALPEREALEMAKNLCVEQTVEFPAAHIECRAIHEHILGRIEDFVPCPGGWRALVSYSDQSATEELPQWLNVIFGNISLLPGITVERIGLSEAQRQWLPGPKYGVPGLRDRFGIGRRPLTFTALKPMGLPAESLAEEAYRCALGGVDLIKDDHGLMDQPFAPFAERVRAVCAAVKRGNAESGHNTQYTPNLSGCGEKLAERLHLAEDCGAGGVLLSPGLTGYDSLRWVSEHTELPVVVHPALAGCLLDKGSGGFDCGCILGQLPRVCGADITVFPNFGGRFSLTKEQCRSIVDFCAGPEGEMPPIFPAPAGGMTFEKLPEMLDFYGADTAFLMGGGLFTVTPDLTDNCARFAGLAAGREEKTEA